MAESYTGENQPTDGAAAKFRGVRADTGAQSEFLSPAGDGVVTEHGKRVAAQRVNQPSTIGMGLAIGTQEDEAADDDDGTWSHMSLLKRLLIRFSGLLVTLGNNLDTVMAVLGQANDAAVASGTGTISGKLRGVLDWLSVLGTESAASVLSGTGTISGKLRGMLDRLASLLTSIGTIADGITDDQADDSSIMGYLRGLMFRLPAALGRTPDAGSLSVTLANEDYGVLGANDETAPANDTAASGLNGRLQRIAQRLTSLIGLLPSSIGQKAKAASLAVTLASDEDLLSNVGALTETAPASDTASSGLNGRLQRIAQRLTSLIGQIPTALGPATPAASLAVTQVANTSHLATAVTVGVAAVALPASALANRKRLTYYNNGTVTHYIGGSGVTTSTGVPIGPGQSYSDDLGPGAVLYAIAAVAGQNGRVVEAA